jgi:pyrimidine operon attenuation protein/uracil phosphoribosyltransferase
MPGQGRVNPVSVLRPPFYLGGVTRIFVAMPTRDTTLLDARAIDRTLKRMADEIVELNDGTDNLILVGIQRRGVQLAERIGGMIQERERAEVPRGALDITLYRDDLQTVGPRPVVGPTDLPWNLDGKRVVIVDDVLYTGRTVRAALDELADFGRPSRIALAVLVDRGGRELPIHADIVGKTVTVARTDRVDVLVNDIDGRDAVVVVKGGDTA